MNSENRAKTDGQKGAETDLLNSTKTSEKAQKQSKTGEKVRKLSGCLFLSIIFGHSPVAIQCCHISETGRSRFRRVRFQAPNSVSSMALTEFRGENSVSSSQPLICVPKRTHRVFSQNSPSLPQNSVRLSEFSSPKQYSRNSIPPVS